MSGYPPPTPEQIMWYRPGNFEVTDSDEGVVFQEGRRSLVLSNLQPQQAGQYTCVVVLSRSPNRHASTQIQLDIYGIVKHTLECTDTHNTHTYHSPSDLCNSSSRNSRCSRMERNHIKLLCQWKSNFFNHVGERRTNTAACRGSNLSSLCEWQYS